jgi:hypothetical protein
MTASRPNTWAARGVMDKPGLVDNPEGERAMPTMSSTGVKP